jgi:hypothetical protein
MGECMSKEKRRSSNQVHNLDKNADTMTLLAENKNLFTEIGVST